MLQWGVVNYVVPADRLQDFARDIAAKITRRSPKAIAQLKRLANLSTCPIPLKERMEEEGKSLYELFHTPEAQKKIQDFANKE